MIQPRKKTSKRKGTSTKSSGFELPEGFAYQKRTYDQVKRRSDQGGDRFDRYTKKEYTVWNCPNDEVIIRVLPPTWKIPKGTKYDDAAYDLWIHYGIGADNSSYLCPRLHKQGPCPICEERDRLSRIDPDENKDAIHDMAPRKRCLVWLIDRDNESEGPMLWGMPKTLNEEIVKRTCQRRTHEIVEYDSPTNGFDIAFEKTGQALQTKYSGVEILHDSQGPMSDDPKTFQEWATFIIDNPLDEVLVFYSYEHIWTVFTGSAEINPKEESEDDVDERAIEESSVFEDEEYDTEDGEEEEVDEEEVDEEEVGEEEDDDDFEEEKALNRMRSRRNRARG
jgi:adenylate kinase family enzyme